MTNIGQLKVLQEAYAQLVTDKMPRPIETVPMGTRVLVWSIANKVWVADNFHPNRENPSMFSTHWLPMPPDPSSSSGRTTEFESVNGGSNPSEGTKSDSIAAMEDAVFKVINGMFDEVTDGPPVSYFSVQSTNYAYATFDTKYDFPDPRQAALALVRMVREYKAQGSSLVWRLHPKIDSNGLGFRARARLATVHTSVVEYPVVPGLSKED